MTPSRVPTIASSVDATIPASSASGPPAESALRGRVRSAGAASPTLPPAGGVSLACWLASVNVLLFCVAQQEGAMAGVALEMPGRDPFAVGRPFGQAGPYERLDGKMRFAVDPDDPANRAI